jgi:quercetin dioxygenase-like cupin family protein
MSADEEVIKGKSITLSDHVEYSDGSIVSKTLINKETGTLTLFAFDAGQALSEHTAPFDAVVEVIDGQAEITIGGKTVTVQKGQIVIMPADIPHALDAKEKFKMLLTMIRS